MEQGEYADKLLFGYGAKVESSSTGYSGHKVIDLFKVAVVLALPGRRGYVLARPYDIRHGIPDYRVIHQRGWQGGKRVPYRCGYGHACYGGGYGMERYAQQLCQRLLVVEVRGSPDYPVLDPVVNVEQVFSRNGFVHIVIGPECGPAYVIGNVLEQAHLRGHPLDSYPEPFVHAVYQLRGRAKDAVAGSRAAYRVVPVVQRLLDPGLAVPYRFPDIGRHRVYDRLYVGVERHLVAGVVGDERGDICLPLYRESAGAGELTGQEAECG